MRNVNPTTEQEAVKELYKMRAVKQLCRALFSINVTPNQEKIVRVIAYGEHKRVTIVCPTRYGKSLSVSMGILLWTLFNKNKKVAIVAPTSDKTTIIRNHIAYFVSRNQIFYTLIDIDKRGYEKIKKEVSRRRMTWKNGVEMRTLSAEGKGEALMGFGADLLIVDETCDIDFEVYRARITRMLGDNPDSVYVEIGNPWHRDNHFWQHWTDPNWMKIHIGWQEALKEGRISQEFLDEQRGQLTEREFMILYEAQFPEESEDQLIKWNWIQHAQRTPEGTIIGEKRLGCDIARSGKDLTVLTAGIKRNDEFIVTRIYEHSQEDTMQTTGRILGAYMECLFEKIIVDTTGIGAGVTDRLNELKKEGKVKSQIVQYMGGQSSTTDKGKERFLNLKAEAYFYLRDLFEKGKIFIPKHAKLIDQLTKMKWELTSSQKIRIMDPGTSETDTAEEKSPDFADSLCYMCFEGKPAFSIGFINLKKEPVKGGKL